MGGNLFAGLYRSFIFLLCVVFALGMLLGGAVLIAFQVVSATRPAQPKMSVKMTGVQPGVLQLTDFGAQPADPGSGAGPDCTPALNAAAAVGGVLQIPPGKWAFNTPPNVIGKTLLIVGAGMPNPGERGTTLVVNYSGQSDFLVFNASQQYLGGSSGVVGVNIYKGRNQSGGCALKFLTVSPSQREGWCQIDKVVVGGYDYAGDTPSVWDRCLYCDGTATPSPPGLRDVWVTRCAFSAATFRAVEVRGACAMSWSGVEVFPGQGSNGDLMFSGTAAVPSQIVHLDGVWVMGTLTLGYIDQFTIRGFAQHLQVMDVASRGLIDVVGLVSPVLGGNGKPRQDGLSGVYVRVGQ